MISLDSIARRSARIRRAISRARRSACESHSGLPLEALRYDVLPWGCIPADSFRCAVVLAQDCELKSGARADALTLSLADIQQFGEYAARDA